MALTGSPPRRDTATHQQHHVAQDRRTPPRMQRISTHTTIAPPHQPPQCVLLQQCAAGLQGPLGVPSLEAWVQEVLSILYVLARRSRAVAAVLTTMLTLLTQLLALCWQPICLSLGALPLSRAAQQHVACGLCAPHGTTLRMTTAHALYTSCSLFTTATPAPVLCHHHSPAQAWTYWRSCCTQPTAIRLCRTL